MKNPVLFKIEDLTELLDVNTIYINIMVSTYTIINNMPYDRFLLSSYYSTSLIPLDLNMFYTYFPDIKNIINHYPSYTYTNIYIELRKFINSEFYIYSSINI